MLLEVQEPLVFSYSVNRMVSIIRYCTRRYVKELSKLKFLGTRKERTIKYLINLFFQRETLKICLLVVFVMIIRVKLRLKNALL